MDLPFTTAQFFEVIERYNETVWPSQVVLTAVAVLALVLVFVRRPLVVARDLGLLALLWAWTGIAYHFAFFTRINPAAYAFGAVFVAGAAAFLWYGVIRRSIAFGPPGALRGTAGGLLVAYALVVYPLWSAATGHPYPSLPTFGLPCPTTIFTIGLLCLASGRGHGIALVAPILWSLVGMQAAFLFHVIPDLGLGVAALVAIALAVARLRARHAPLDPPMMGAPTLRPSTQRRTPS